MRPSTLFAAGAALLIVSAPLPYDWTHTLGPTCHWRSRGALAVLGRASPTGRAKQREVACWRVRGGQDHLGKIHTLLAHWPTQAQLATWNGEFR